MQLLTENDSQLSLNRFEFDNALSIQKNSWSVPEFQCYELLPKSSPYVLLIPVLNEGIRIQTQLLQMERLKLQDQLDVLIVDGGSFDDSLNFEFLKKVKVRCLMVQKPNQGKLSSQLRLGLSKAMLDGYEGVILMDGNNKDNPKDAFKFMEALKKGVDHVQGSRFIRGGKHENTPLLRQLAIRLIHAPLVSLSSGYWYTDTTNGFRAYSRRFLLDPKVAPFREIFQRYELHYYLAIRASCLKFNIQEIPVERKYPAGKVTNKIKGFMGLINIFEDLFKACLHKLDP